MAKKENFKSRYTNEEIESTLVRSNTAPFYVFYDLQDEINRFFIDEAHAIIWEAERKLATEEGRAMNSVIAAYDFSPGIAGSPNYTAFVEFLHGDGERVPEGSTGNFISIRPRIEDRSKNDTRESIGVYINISNNGESRPPIYDIVRSNSVYTVNIDDYLRLGDNEIVITIVGRASTARKTVVMSYNVFRLAIDCGFNYAQPLPQKKNFSVNYSIRGNGQKEVYFYIDGAMAANHTVSANESEATLSQNIMNTGDKALSPGKHTLQIYAVSNGYSSDLLYYEFMVEGLESILTTVLVAYRFPAGTAPFSGNVPGFTGTQYIPRIINWAYYSNDPSQRNPLIIWRLFANGVETHLATRTADILEAENGKLPTPLEFMPTEFGKYRLQAVIDGYDYISPDAHHENDGADHNDPRGLIACYSIDVEKNLQVQEAIDNLTVKLTALGRSNDEPEEIRKQLSDRGIYAEYHNMPFNNRYGHIDNADVFGGGAYLTIPLNPFSADFDVRENGNSIEIDFETFEVKDENVPLFLIGNLDDFHVCIYPTKAEIKTSRGVGPEVRFRPNTRYNIVFVTHPDTDLEGQTRRFMEMYVDGIRTAIVQYGSTDSLVIDEGGIIIGDPNALAGIKLYNFLSYSGTLRDYNVLNNTIIHGGMNINALVKRNDIYVEGSRVKVSVDKLKGVSSKIDFHQSGTEKGTRERVRSKVTKFGYLYKFLSSF